MELEMELDGHGYPIGKKLGLFENKTICVFGGTGTVGSLIVEYLITQKPKIIRVFSNDEKSLWEKQRKWGWDNLRYPLGDIRDLERVIRVLNGVDYAFNCAAVKHVPNAEYNPMEAVLTNIIGLSNIIEGCYAQNVDKLFHMSTDKAVEPSTIMGATKMIGERLLQNRWASNPLRTDMVCVRAGNIYNSTGSLQPLIMECIKEGKSIPLTDPKMMRFVIDQDILLEFIMKAFTEGHNGDIWVPKMEEKSIIDIIHGEVDLDYPIEIIGKRKGEKLREKLISEGEMMFVEEFETYWIIKNERFKG